MIGSPRRARWIRALVLLALFGLAGAAVVRAQSYTPCDLAHEQRDFPHIPICVFTGAYRDSSLIRPDRCVGSFTGPQPESVLARPRTVTVRFLRDRRAEARSDFGGYRIYRVINSPDSTYMVLIRRFSRQTGDERMWSFSVVDTSTLQFICRSRQGLPQVVNDSIVTFVDPDSVGNWIKVCRLRKPQSDIHGECQSPGDTVYVLDAPPGPHDGFRTWYAITYEGRNESADGNYADLFVPDLANCTSSNPDSCPNLNHKLLNLAGPVEPTGGPTKNLERVVVVPNPYRASAAQWEGTGPKELHFINLPTRSLIRIYTVAGDLVAVLQHQDPIRDFEPWNLKNANGQDVSSGIYMYRVEAQSFSFQDRFIVIR